MTATRPPVLTIELVPSSCWYKNVRSNVLASTWDRLQALTAAISGNRCSICGGAGPRHPVECHEIWTFDDHLRLQRLDGLTALCPECHGVKHIGRALANGQVARPLAWYCHINRTTPAEAAAAVRAALQLNANRSGWHFQLDVLWLRRVGVDLNSVGVEVGHTPLRLDY
ncbi:HNH endonuclease [Xanthomonas sacchari]|uniref:HNH endonuclease n=1 Tax=Xanthomonas sacchari TaxID=56458 RepID=UPI0027D80F2A|nr:HNH endonuclease [Xanthomonas sacchari]